jgi:predicted regulator of Ras-like GTPase activity (Roadblock/LC7/MglB family)
VRRSDLGVFVGALADPIQRFVQETGVRLVLLINASGQVLAQHGFSRSLDVMSIATLGAAIHSSSRVLAELLDQPQFAHLHQGRGANQVFIGPFATPSEEVILIAVFDENSSVGLVRLFFEALAREIAALPGWRTARPTVDATAFENDLEAGLEHTFGN